MFRIRIGNFHSTKIKENKFKPTYSKMNKLGQSWRLPKLFLSLILLLVLCTTNISTCQNSRSFNLQEPNIAKSSHQTGSSEIPQQCNRNLFSMKMFGISVNKIQKITNGNRRSVGYKLGVWNCGRGLVQENFSSKLHEIKQFIENKKPHCYCVIESDFYSHLSPINRLRKYTTDEIREKLKIDGYKIEFPQTWDSHGQARLICYVSEDIKYIRKHFGPMDTRTWPMKLRCSYYESPAYNL